MSRLARWNSVGMLSRCGVWPVWMWPRALASFDTGVRRGARSRPRRTSESIRPFDTAGPVQGRAGRLVREHRGRLASVPDHCRFCGDERGRGRAVQCWKGPLGSCPLATSSARRGSARPILVGTTGHAVPPIGGRAGRAVPPEKPFKRFGGELPGGELIVAGKN